MKYHIKNKTHLIILTCLNLINLLFFINPNLLLSLHMSCFLKTVFHFNCPFCGMTRDFVLMSIGEIPNHNPFSIFIMLIFYIIYPIAVLYSIYQRKKISIRYISIRNIFIATMLIMFIFNNLNHWR